MIHIFGGEMQGGRLLLFFILAILCWNFFALFLFGLFVLRCFVLLWFVSFCLAVDYVLYSPAMAISVSTRVHTEILLQ